MEELNFNPILTFAGKSQVKVPQERKFSDISDDFRTPSVNEKELLARRMYSTMQALQQLTHIDKSQAVCLMVSIPQLETREQRDNLARIFNKSISVDNGAISVHCATVSMQLNQIIAFVLFNNESIDVSNQETYQLINDTIASIAAKFTIFKVMEASTQCFSLIGSIGQFDGSILGIKYHQILYDQCSTISLIYCDPRRYQGDKQSILQIGLLLSGNNASRIVLMRGFPVSCIVLRKVSLTKQQSVFNSLDGWERCVAFLIIKSVGAEEPSGSGNMSSRKNSGIFTTNFENNGCENGEEIISEQFLVERSSSIMDDTVKKEDIITKSNSSNQKALDIYTIAKRDPDYKQDSAIELNNLLKNQIRGDFTFLTTTPSAPQDLVQISLKIQNMRTFECVKTVEQIISELGGYQIEIDLASGFVQFQNTNMSRKIVKDALEQAGFGCQVLQQQFKIDQQVEVTTLAKKYSSIWTMRVLIAGFVWILIFVLRCVQQQDYTFQKIVSYIEYSFDLILISLNFRFLYSGIVTGIKRKRQLPEMENAIAILINIIVNTMIIVNISISHGKEQYEYSKLSQSLGIVPILFIVAVARLIEQYGKKKAVKNFNGLAESLPQEVYVLKNLLFDKLVKYFKIDMKTTQLPSQSFTLKMLSQNKYSGPMQQDEDSDFDFPSFIKENNIDEIINVIRMKRSSTARDMLPDDTQLALKHQIQTMSILTLSPGQVLVVYRGETIPCDGYILQGFSPIDESFISKSHEGISKGPGDKVYAGTRVLSADIYVCCCAVGHDTLIGHLISAVKRSTTQANKVLLERDDLHVERNKNSKDLTNKIMYYFRPIMWVATLIVSIGWIFYIIISPGMMIKLKTMYNIETDTKLMQIVIAIIYLSQVVTCMLIIASPVAYSMCYSLISLVGTNAFGKQSLIIRDCARVCEKLDKIKVIAFPRTGGLTYGKPLVTSINVHIEISKLVDLLIEQGLIMGDCTKEQCIYFVDKSEFVGKDELIKHLFDVYNFNRFLDANPSVKQVICARASSLLKEATSLILASSNGITAGLVTCLKVLQEQKFTRYISRTSSIQKFNIPYVQEYQYNPEKGVYRGIVLNGEKSTEISICNKQTTEQSLANTLCFQISNLVEELQIRAVKQVVDQPNTAVYHLKENKIHVMDFVISDSIRIEAEEVIQELKEKYRVIVTSTDTSTQCNKTADAVGILRENVFADINFDDKPKVLLKLADQFGKILYVCDGVNDLKCTAYVDVSLAITDGRDGIKAATDIVSLKCSLEDIPITLKMAKLITNQLKFVSRFAASLSMLTVPFSAGILAFVGCLVTPNITCLLTAFNILIIFLLCQNNLKIKNDTQKIAQKQSNKKINESADLNEEQLY